MKKTEVFLLTLITISLIACGFLYFSNKDKLDGEKNVGKRVVCFGDSLTSGTGGKGVNMPDILHRMSGAEVINYGIHADTINDIATRSGASKFTLVNNILIPSEPTPVEISFTSEFGDIPNMLKHGDEGLNPVTIDGIKGNILKIENEDDDESDEDETEVITYSFTRLEAGDEKQIQSGAEIIPFAALDKKDDDINIIWTDGNARLQSTEEIIDLIEKIDKMLAYSGSDKYIIVSEMNLHEDVPVTDEVNEMFEKHYGKHFVNLRKYFIEEALSDLGLEPSDEDLETINLSDVPKFLRVDDVHGNSIYYYLAGKKIYERCQKLGYLR